MLQFFFVHRTYVKLIYAGIPNVPDFYAFNRTLVWLSFAWRVS
jgi:hypothetical protein